MNATLKAALDAELALLTRMVTPPTGPLGYGTDLDCITDVQDDFREVDPISPRAIVQALARRYQTPRGTLEDDRDYGFDIRSYCNRGVTSDDLRSLSLLMVAEGRKDDRVDDIAVSVFGDISSSELRCDVKITPAIPGIAPFSATLSVTDSEVLIQTISTTA